MKWIDGRTIRSIVGGLKAAGKTFHGIIILTWLLYSRHYENTVLAREGNPYHAADQRRQFTPGNINIQTYAVNPVISLIRDNSIRQEVLNSTDCTINL